MATGLWPPSRPPLADAQKGASRATRPERSRAGATTSATRKTPLSRLAYPRCRPGFARPRAHARRFAPCAKTQSHHRAHLKDKLGGRSVTGRLEGHVPRSPRRNLGFAGRSRGGSPGPRPSGGHSVARQRVWPESRKVEVNIFADAKIQRPGQPSPRLTGQGSEWEACSKTFRLPEIAASSVKGRAAP